MPPLLLKLPLLLRLLKRKNPLKHPLPLRVLPRRKNAEGEEIIFSLGFLAGGVPRRGEGVSDT